MDILWIFSPTIQIKSTTYKRSTFFKIISQKIPLLL